MRCIDYAKRWYNWARWICPTHIMIYSTLIYTAINCDKVVLIRQTYIIWPMHRTLCVACTQKCNYKYRWRIDNNIVRLHIILQRTVLNDMHVRFNFPNSTFNFLYMWRHFYIKNDNQNIHLQCKYDNIYTTRRHV